MKQSLIYKTEVEIMGMSSVNFVVDIWKVKKKWYLDPLKVCENQPLFCLLSYKYEAARY